MNGAILVTWLGHACFRMEHRGWSLIIDPYADGYVDGLPPLRAAADAVYCTHGHGDHNAADVITVSGANPPEDFRVCTVSCPHDDRGGALRGMNEIHRFSFGERTVVHMGDVGCCPLEEETVRPLRGCDLLLIPVGGFFTVDAAAARALTEQIAPRAVAPMHYRSEKPAFGFDVLSTVEDFAALFPAEMVTRLDGPSFSLTETGPKGLILPRLILG